MATGFYNALLGKKELRITSGHFTFFPFIFPLSFSCVSFKMYDMYQFTPCTALISVLD